MSSTAYIDRFFDELQAKTSMYWVVCCVVGTAIFLKWVASKNVQEPLALRIPITCQSIDSSFFFNSAYPSVLD